MKNQEPNHPAVICKDIYKFYGKGETRVEALRGVDLIVNRGELRMLMGPSGSGKTTLISIIAGILTQTSGECILDSVNLNRLSDEEKTNYRKNHIGFVFQLFNLIPTINIAENISIPLLLNGIERKEAYQKVKELLTEFNMVEKIDAYPRELSGGQQQRVAIARAIIHNPHLVVCDEPTSFLDHETGIVIMQILKKMVAEKNLTLIVVTHDPRIIEFADKIDHMEDGKIVENK